MIDKDTSYDYVNEGYAEQAEFEQIDRESWQALNVCLNGLKFSPTEIVKCC